MSTDNASRGSAPPPSRSALSGFIGGVEERLSAGSGDVWMICEPEEVEEGPPDSLTDPVWTPSGWMERERAVPDGDRKVFTWTDPSDVETQPDPARTDG